MKRAEEGVFSYAITQLLGAMMENNIDELVSKNPLLSLLVPYPPTPTPPCAHLSLSPQRRVDSSFSR